MDSPNSYPDLHDLIHNPANPAASTPRTPAPYSPRVIDFDEETLDGDAELAMDAAIEELNDDDIDTDEEVAEICTNEDVKWITTLAINRSVRLAKAKAQLAAEPTISVLEKRAEEGAKKRKRASLYPAICRTGLLGKGIMAIASPVDTNSDVLCNRLTIGTKNGELTSLSDVERTHWPCRVTDKYAFYLWDDTFWAPLIVKRRVPECFPFEPCAGTVRTPKGRLSAGDLYVVTDPAILARYREHMLLVRHMQVGVHRYLTKYSSCYAIQEDNSAIDFCKLNFQDWFEDSGRPNIYKEGGFGSFECFVTGDSSMYTGAAATKAFKRTVKKSMLGALMNATTGAHLTLSDIRIDMCDF